MVSHPFWTVSGKNVRGAAHIRHEKPCQDAFLPLQVDDAVIAAVADGHGSQRCPFSDEGAWMAVETVSGLLQELYVKAEKDPAVIEKLAKEKLPHLLVGRWRERVKAAHVAQGRVESAEAVDDAVLVQYGSTVLAVLATEVFLLFVQLGDGDILTVAEDGQVSAPLPKDERLMANETTSLCSPRAWEDVVVQFYPLTGRPAPALVMLSTDGYSNSFSKQEDFHQVGTDFLQLIREHGLATVMQHMGGWLEQTSQEGSGDDITVSLLCQFRLAEPMIEEVSAAVEMLEEPVKKKATRSRKKAEGATATELEAKPEAKPKRTRATKPKAQAETTAQPPAKRTRSKQVVNEGGTTHE